MGSVAKKVVSFVLFVIILTSACAPLLVVHAASDHQSHLDPNKPYDILMDNSINYTCRYDESNDKVVISGTVNHDILIAHREYMLEVYAIAPGQSIESTALSPQAESKASAAIAIKFDFSISALTMTDRFSMYAIVLRSPEGDKVLGAEPQYTYVASSYEYNTSDAMPYKGISSHLTALAGSVNAGTAIIPVYLNQLLSDNTGGIVYPLEDGFCYFNRLYVEELDTKIKTYSALGTRVYFQFLLQAGASDLSTVNGAFAGATYDFPDLTQKENLQKIAAASEFLAARYDGRQNALLSGLVVGSAIDQKMQNYTVGLSLEQYAERYAFYFLTVSNAARMKNAALDVLIPFSEVDTYSLSQANQEIVVDAGNYSPSLLLEEILSFWEERLNGSFAYGTMIETSVLPLTWSEAESKLIEDQTITESLTPTTILEYEAYLNGLQRASDKAPSHFIYRWNVPLSLREDFLACNYAYTYYYLLRYQDLSSFVVSFDDGMTREAFTELLQILRYIDTAKGTSVTSTLLSSFAQTRWEDVLGVQTMPSTQTRRVYRLPSNTSPLTDYKGSFEYFDFSSASTDLWNLGIGCQKIRNDLLDDVRGIQSEMLNDRAKGPSELLCLYEFLENFVYTPYLKLTLELPSEGKELYEITVSLGNDQVMILSEQLVFAGERCEIWLDLREVSKEDLMTKSLKIGAELVEGDVEGFSLWVLGLTGYSQEYTSEELTELIQDERLRIRNENAEENADRAAANVLWVVFAILFFVSSLVIGILLFVRRKEERADGEESEESDSQQ